MNAAIVLKGRRGMWQDIYVREKLRDFESERERRYAAARPGARGRTRETPAGGLWRRIAGALPALAVTARAAGRRGDAIERVHHLGVAPGDRGAS